MVDFLILRKPGPFVTIRVSGPEKSATLLNYQLSTSEKHNKGTVFQALIAKKRYWIKPKLVSYFGMMYGFVGLPMEFLGIGEFTDLILWASTIVPNLKYQQHCEEYGKCWRHVKDLGSMSFSVIAVLPFVSCGYQKSSIIQMT